MFQLPAQALCAPSLLTMAVECSGVGHLPEPMAGLPWGGAVGRAMVQGTCASTSPVAKASRVGWGGVGVLPSHLGCVSSSTFMAVASPDPKRKSVVGEYTHNNKFLQCFTAISVP